jgi:FkbM family methyltransferase
VKKRVPFAAMRVAIDIVARYFEGGLKYGGPCKNDKYQPKTGDVVAEMGAYRGYFILRLCDWIGESGKVVAIEPIPDNLRVLKKNLKANSINNCVIIEKGVWHEPDRMVLNRKEHENQSASLVLAEHGEDRHSVPVDSLDNILKEAEVDHCNFMVIQLNGVEINALNGMTEVRPENLAIAARYDIEGQNAIEAIKKWMNDNGYKYQIVQRRFIFASLASSQANVR